MRRSLFISLACLAIVLQSVWTVTAQQPASIADLKSQIEQLQKLVSDPRTGNKASDLKLLSETRAKLRASLQNQIEALRRYQTAYQYRFSARESKAVRDSIQLLEEELQNPLGGSSHHVIGQAVPTVTKLGNREVAPAASRVNVGAGTTLSMTSHIPQSKPITSGEYARVTRAGSRTTNGGLSATRNGGAALTNPLTPAPAPQASASCPSCRPSDPADEKKDFIISARTGETRGRKKFGLHDNARIIITEKNPFLYEYRVTLKDKPILEPAIAEFFGNFPLFADALKPKAAAAGASAQGLSNNSSDACAQLAQRFPVEVNTLVGLRQALEADDSSTPGVASLRNRYLKEKKAYDEVAQQVDGAKKVLYDQNASCPNLCSTATGIRSTLQAYRPDVQQLSDSINLFKSRADSFQLGIQDLDEKIRNSNPAIPNSCYAFIDELRPLASGYKETAATLETGVQKITNGKKTFDAIVKTINNVFSNPNAFYQVYTRGEYNLPTDVEITVERKDLTNEDATFAKVVEGETVNFGGGARFALAGGIVVSPLETVNFKRVPALINGRATTIVGKDEGSNTRILPMLMLHGRLMEGRGAISGLHLSIGITAKPNDTGTNVEFLVGPSLSFIEERLFLTFGGYAGRRKQLEGNLIPGQELPKEFSNDIPTSDHLVWKPGVALTYKLK